MKYREGKLTKFLKFRTIIDDKARKKFINSQPEGKRSLARKFYRENEKEVKKELREEYLSEHPEIKRQYEKWKKQIIMVAGIGVATTLGVGCIICNSVNNKEESQKDPIQIEQERILEEGIAQIEKQEEENIYDAFFNEAREIKNTEERDNFITNQTKKIIVEAYNKKHPENHITIEQLEILDYHPFVLKRTDKLGNYTYERHPEDKTYIKTETEETVQKQIYEFKIEGKTVAAFYDKGSLLIDKNIEKQDIWFEEMIPLMEKSQNLKDVYKYKNSDYDRQNVEQIYKREAEKILENENNIDVPKEQEEKIGF